MLNEDQIRNLLLKAGDTVAVEPAAPVVTPLPPSRWRMAAIGIAAAATVAGIAGTGLWLAGGDDSTSDGGTTVLGGVPDGSVPSVFAHTQRSATEMLQGLGLEVDYREEVSCEPAGRPIGTVPATGKPIDEGDKVTVLISYQAANTDCFSYNDEEWAFVDFATGRGPAPRFANQVRLFVDGELVTTMPGETAAEGIWPRPSALTELATAADQVMKLNDEYRTPTLQVQRGTPPDEFCGTPRPALLGAREASTLTIDIPVDGVFHCPVRVSVYRSGGAIDAVVTWTEHGLNEAPEAPSMPNTVGMKLDDARAVLTDAGYTVSVEEIESCDPREGIVVEQAPGQTPAFDQDIDPDDDFRGVVVTLVVEVPHQTRDCAGLEAAAAGFIRFARGGAPPVWAPEVQQLFGFARHNRISAAEADSPYAWSFCSGLGPQECGLSPLAWIAQEEQVGAAQERVNYECELIDNGGLPVGLDYADAIHLFPRAAATDCEEQWEVALWIDESGGIKAVNLLVPQAAASE